LRIWNAISFFCPFRSGGVFLDYLLASFSFLLLAC
jgi:hypothetical protein